MIFLKRLLFLLVVAAMAFAVARPAIAASFEDAITGFTEDSFHATGKAIEEVAESGPSM